MNNIENGTVVEVAPNHRSLKIPDGYDAIVDNVNQELGRFDFALLYRENNKVFRGSMAVGKHMLHRPLKELIEVSSDGNQSRVIWNHE